MANNTFVSEKRKALLAHKEKILEELKYYDKRIQDEQSKTKIEYYLDDASSDSDDDFSITTDLGPSIMQLKMEQSKLRTCLQATQELTNLQILQSEVNVVVKEPVLTRESPVKEPGTWREVTAECRIDLIPFSITFYMHKSNGKYGAKSYRGLQVMLVKAAHEAELSHSILPTVVRPSDAVEVLRSYAEAYRSRRSTLARLASKYEDSLYMEPMADGGYLLKCANLLQVAWRLENKWSPLARFHHRMKFDLEYMEEKYINTITESHKQLADPTISTDERTLLLSKIIATCLEAKPVSESADSDQETRLPKRRATLDQEIEEPDSKKKKEVMAPPKSLPKRAKISKTAADKLKPGNSSNKTKTSAVTGEGDKENVDNNLNANNKNVPSDKNVGSVEKSVATGSKSSQKQVEKTSKTLTSTKNVVESSKDKVMDKNNIEAELKNKKTKTVPRNTSPETQSDNVEQLIEKPQAKKKSEINDKNKKVGNSNNAETGANKKPAKEITQAKNIEASKEPSSTNNNKNKKNKDVTVDKNSNAAVQDGKASGKKNKVKDGSASKNKNNDANDAKKNNADTATAKTNKKVSKENADVNIIPKNIQASETKQKTVPKTTEKAKKSVATNKAVEKNIANVKNKDMIVDITKKVSTKSVANSKEKLNEANKDKDPVNKEITVKSNSEPSKVKKSTDAKKVIEKKSAANDKNKPTNNIMNVTITKEPSDKEKRSNPKMKTSQEKIIKDGKNVESTGQLKKSVLPLRMQNNLKILRKSIGNITKASNKNIVVKENAIVKSKIPQKKLSPLNEKMMRKNPLRMSPRHMASTFNTFRTQTSSSVTKASIQKSTNIPRLTKPMFKAK